MAYLGGDLRKILVGDGAVREGREGSGRRQRGYVAEQLLQWAAGVSSLGSSGDRVVSHLPGGKLGVYPVTPMDYCQGLLLGALTSQHPSGQSVHRRSPETKGPGTGLENSKCVQEREGHTLQIKHVSYAFRRHNDHYKGKLGICFG